MDDAASATHWFPLSPDSVTTSNSAQAVVQADRSILVSGNADAGSYQITCTTPLRGLRGFRLEALALPSIPGGGPGLAAQGNFVITEFEVTAAPTAHPEKTTPVKIARGQADFSQDTFAIEQTFDGN
ncbi:MAG: hypothetical protein R3C56_32060 [Pirellulaceae bacterium]